MEIHRFDHSRVNGHAFCLIAFLRLAQATPIPGGGHGHHVRGGWNNAKLYGPDLALLTQCLPAAVIHAHIAIDKFLRRLHRNVYCLHRQIGEEGARIVSMTVNELNGLVDQEAGRVEILRQLEFLTIGKPVGFFINGNIGFLFPVVGAGIGHGHRALKTATTGQQVRRHTQVPFSRHVGVVARILQQRGHGHHVAPQNTLVVGVLALLRGNHFRDIGDAGPMAVHTRQQHRTSGRTTGRRVVIGKADALFRQGRQRGCSNLAAVRGDITKAQIVGQDQHNIGAGSRLGICPPGCSGFQRGGLHRELSWSLLRQCGLAQAKHDECFQGKSH